MPKLPRPLGAITLSAVTVLAFGAFLFQSQPTIAKFARIATGYGYGTGCLLFGYSHGLCNSATNVKIAWHMTPVVAITSTNGSLIEAQPFTSYTGQLSFDQARLRTGFPQVAAAVQLQRSSQATQVKLYDYLGNAFQTFAPFGSGYTRGARLKLADLTGDGVKDLLVAPRVGANVVVYTFNVTLGEFERRGQLLAVPANTTSDIIIGTVKPTGQGKVYVSTLAKVRGANVLHLWTYNRTTKKFTRVDNLLSKIKVVNGQVVPR